MNKCYVEYGTNYFVPFVIPLAYKPVPWVSLLLALGATKKKKVCWQFGQTFIFGIYLKLGTYAEGKHDYLNNIS